MSLKKQSSAISNERAVQGNNSVAILIKGLGINMGEEDWKSLCTAPLSKTLLLSSLWTLGHDGLYGPNRSTFERDL